MKTSSRIFLVISLFMFCVIPNLSFGQTKATNTQTTSKVSASKLKSDMRILWEDHVILSRQVILGLLGKQPGADESMKRLFQNQTDIGDAMKTYYGKNAGDTLAHLLTLHISHLMEIIMASKSGNTTVLSASKEKWAINSEKIAVFLKQLNPSLSLPDLKARIQEHQSLTIAEINEGLTPKDSNSIKSYNKVHKEILEFSDIISSGITKQFPEKF